MRAIPAVIQDAQRDRLDRFVNSCLLLILINDGAVLDTLTQAKGVGVVLE